METTQATPPAAPLPPGAPAAPPAPLERPNLAKTRCALEAGAALLGVACLLACLFEALTGEPTVSEEFYGCYILLLMGYASAREGEKWFDPAAEDAPRFGHLFIWGWVGLVALIALLQGGGWSRPRVVWPASLNSVFYYVLGAYLGTRFFGMMRRSGWRRSFYPGASAALRAARTLPAVPAPAAPIAEPSPAVPFIDSAPEPIEPELEPEPEPRSQTAKAYERLAAYMMRRGGFNCVEIAGDAGVSASTVYRYVLMMIKDGLVAVKARGSYRWLATEEQLAEAIRRRVLRRDLP